MRDFLFGSEELLDKNAYECLEKEYIPGILPCRWVRWNSMIQLVYFTESLTSISDMADELTLDELRTVGNEIIDYDVRLEEQMDLSAENVVWDLDTIYLDEDFQVHIICLPAVIPIESLDSKIYIKRVYAVLNDLFSLHEDGRFICRQIDAQSEKDPSDWDSLRAVIEIREPKEDETITLRGINTPEPVVFEIGHEEFVLGSDDTVDGCLKYESISPVHALIGWNEISFYIEDMGSEQGTYLNDVQLSPNRQTPFGRGIIIRFGDHTFTVE